MKKKILITISMIGVLSSCATDIKSSTYSSASVGEASFSYQGTVISKRTVLVQDSDKLSDHQGAATVGGVGGALIGNQIGGGDSLIGLLVGGTIGALGSAKVAKQLGEQKGFEYVIKLTNNQILTVVQGLDAIFEIGAHVMILVSHDGRSRVIADNSPIQEVQAPINTPSVIIKKNR